MFPAAEHLLRIKDLKDLSIFLGRRCYRHAGPKRPEEIFSYAGDRGGQAPALRARKVFASPCARSGSGEPELQRARCLQVGETSLPSRPGGLSYLKKSRPGCLSYKDLAPIETGRALLRGHRLHRERDGAPPGKIETGRALLLGRHRDMKHPQLM